MTIRTWSGVSYTAVGRLIKQILDYYPGDHGSLYITSSYRSHTPGSHHGGRLYYGGSRTAAVDIGFGYGSSGATARGRALADWLMKFKTNEVELIHSPRHYVKNGRTVGPYSVSLHYNHVHIAMSETQARRVLAQLRGGKVPSGGSGSSKNGPAGSVRSVGSQQKEVNAAGYSPKLTKDGRWGPKTEAAVKWYQKKIGVTADGVWGKGTDAAHKRYKKSGSKFGPTGSVRSIGSQQKEVNAAGYSPKLKRDGQWGPATEAGVKWYQRKIGVTADGVWGTGTDAAHRRFKDSGKSTPVKPKPSSSGKLAVDGQFNTATKKALQKELGVTVDGVFGPASTRALQKRIGAKVDGQWGLETTRKLQEYLNKR